MQKIIKYLIILILLAVFVYPAFAEEGQVLLGVQKEQALQDTQKTQAEQGAEKPRWLQGVEFLTGFGVAKLHEKATYHPIPFFVDFDFDANPLLKKININNPALFQLILEPFLAYSYQPDNNAEIGNNFLIKIGFLPMTSKLQPYFRGGIGFVYITQHMREQGTQFNFNEYGAVGMHYFFKKNVALTAEYRFRHLSNAGMRYPNRGINTNYGICGVSYLF